MGDAARKRKLLDLLSAGHTPREPAHSARQHPAAPRAQAVPNSAQASHRAAFAQAHPAAIDGSLFAQPAQAAAEKRAKQAEEHAAVMQSGGFYRDSDAVHEPRTAPAPAPAPAPAQQAGAQKRAAADGRHGGAVQFEAESGDVLQAVRAALYTEPVTPHMAALQRQGGDIPDAVPFALLTVVQVRSRAVLV